MAPRRHISCRIIGTLVCLLIASTAEAAPPEGKPVLVPVWKKSTVGFDRNDVPHSFEEYKGAGEWLAKRYAVVLDERKNAGRPLIPPATPTGIDDWVVVANDRSMATFALRKTTSGDGQHESGELVWMQDRDSGLVQMVKELGPRTMTDNWMRKQESGALADLMFNRTLGNSFTASRTRVHFVDELGILPPANEMRGKMFHAGVFSSQLASNSIKVADLGNGKLIGKLPDYFSEPKVPERSVFLSVPLEGDNEWFTLHELNRSVRISRFDWRRASELLRKGQDVTEQKCQTWQTELFIAPTSAVKDPHRRIHAIHLVRSRDLIISPTHLGYVVAVDAAKGKQQWFFEYASIVDKRFETFAPEWVVVPPVVVGDKYIYAPADFPELLCLNVADGKKVWSVKKGDGLYPAVVGEQVLVIGEKTLRSLSLKDGSEQWKIDLPGLPCGRGAVLGDTYLLPVSEPKTWSGMIAIVDLKTQKIREVLKPDKDEPIGNLVVHQDMLISLTLTEIAVYPIRK